MHEDQVGVIRHLGQARRDGVRPGGAARHRRGHLPGREVIGQQGGRLLPALGHHQHDPVDRRVLLEQLHGMGQQHPVAERHERLRPVGAEPGTVARTDDDRPRREQVGHWLSRRRRRSS
jgi:hypothetical protein